MFWHFIVLLSNFAFIVLAQDLQCHEKGQCSGLISFIDDSNSYNHCLDLCIANSNNCEWFTYFQDTRECVHFLDCPMIDPVCSNCFTGQKECPKELVCNAVGFCIGHFITANHTQSADECLRFCRSVDECRWFTFVDDTNNCALTEDCVTFDDTCTDCISGERDCPLQSEQQKLFIVGGDEALNKVEVVSLGGGDQSCTNISDFASAQRGSVGTYIDNKTLVCGGFVDEVVGSTNGCFYYVASTNTWVQAPPMIASRRYAAAVQLTPTEWWVTGGRTSTSNIPVSTSEVLTVGAGFSTFTSLPSARAYHNLLKVNSTHVVLLGGEFVSTTAWIFDIEAETWSSLPGMLVATSYTQAGVVTYPDGRVEIVVAAGETTSATQFFSFETQTWRLGPDFPAGRLREGSSVPYGDTFLVVGGLVGELLYQDSIYIFNSELQAFEELPETLAARRSLSAAFLVPHDFISCN